MKLFMSGFILGLITGVVLFIILLIQYHTTKTNKVYQ
jgi:hypothetical protein